MSNDTEHVGPDLPTVPPGGLHLSYPIDVAPTPDAWADIESSWEQGRQLFEMVETKVDGLFQRLGVERDPYRYTLTKGVSVYEIADLLEAVVARIERLEGKE